MYSKIFAGANILALVLGTTPAALMAQTAAPSVAVPTDAAAATPLDPKEVKAAEKARLKAEHAAQQAKAARMREWKRLYGPGPYPDELDAFAATHEEKLRPYYRVLYADGEHNSVLNYQRLGLLAMEDGVYKSAEESFDGALIRIEAFFSKDRQAARATQLTRKEVNKDYKGEPYERAMAYYYRGLLYLRTGDYDNARASFKAAEYQDTVSEEEEFKSDFALLNYLSGWASHCAGDQTLAQDAFAAAVATDKALVAPAATDNVLVIAELGRGPAKIAKGQYKEALGFERVTDFDEDGATMTLTPRVGDAMELKLHNGVDLYTQATTRGGRAIDSILNGKAQTKESMEQTGNALMTSGMMQGGDTGTAAMGIGLLVGLLSTSVRPTADIRNWDSLPNTVLIGTGHIPPGEFQAQTRYWKGTAPMDGITGTVPMVAQAGRCSIVWTRSRSVADLKPEAPGDDVKIAAQRKKDQAALAKDLAFRTSLAGK